MLENPKWKSQGKRFARLLHYICRSQEPADDFNQLQTGISPEVVMDHGTEIAHQQGNILGLFRWWRVRQRCTWYYATIVVFYFLAAADRGVAQVQGAPCLKDQPNTCILKAHIPILSVLHGEMKIFNIFWDDHWDQRNPLKMQAINDATQTLLKSKYFAKLSQYGIKGMGWGGSTDTNHDPLTCHRAPVFPVDMVLSVFAFLACEEASGPGISGVPFQEAFPSGTCQVCASVPGGCFSNLVDSMTCLFTGNASGNTIYNIFVPSYVRIEDVGGAFASCKDYGAFHAQIPSLQVGFLAGGTQGRPLYFTVIPTQCYGNNLEGVMGAVAHELAEAATDPLPLFHWYDESTDPIGRPVNLTKLVEFARQSEVADLCQFQWDVAGARWIKRPSFQSPNKNPPFAVPLYWSNSDNGCVAGGLDGFPSIQITSPRSGDSVLWGKQVSFASTITAAYMKGLAVQWRSDRDGDLCNGITCDAKSLSFGSHTIIATVTDGHGATATDSIKLFAINKPPSVYITNPPKGSTFFTSQKISLRGFGSSPSENDIPDARLAWSSNLSGALATGHRVLVNLKAGVHTITLAAADLLGERAAASIIVTVNPGDDVPTALILSPGDNASFGSNDVITFQGAGTDPLDGVLADSSLEWSSNVDGLLGTGKSISVRLKGNTIAPVSHKITLRVTNSAGKQATITITVLVGSVG